MVDEDQETELTSERVGCRGIDHIALRVSSLADSLPYYAALLPLLGFARVGETAWRNRGGLLLHFSEADEGSRPYDRFGPGMNHLGFAVPSAASVALVRESMAAAGFAVPELQTFAGITALFMKDPDGIRFEITCEPGGEGRR
jgi:catechol 2,3-dioxygenase-like lactoylglutathione lyase family enzyme